MDLKGRLLGNRYEIIEKIGSGGMATVYKAKCHVLNRYVAIKILRDEFTTDDEFIKRFEVEAQSAASITHPNIVSVYDVGADGNLYYIVMELIKGKTLKEIIVEEKGPLPWKWSVNIAGQIASALETAHKNHIIHRDIKPHNIIITEDGVAKVTDFGIAKAVSNSTITAFGTTIGSVHYFSPEHARGGYTDEKSDLYSLGVVMYEMLTGKVPFDADTPVSVALKHIQEEPTPPIEVNPNIPSAVNDIIMKALRKDTNLRYQNATAMLLDLKRALKEPNGDFVDNNDYQNDFPTQRISTIGIEEESRKQNSANKNGKKKNKFVEFIKKHKTLSIIVGLMLLFVISIALTIGISNATRPKDVDIPNLTGKTVDEAKEILKQNKLNYIEEDQEYNTEVPEGQIISQNPPYVEGRKIKENTDIKVVVSKGTETTTVPKLKGLTTIKVYISIGTGIKQVKVVSVVGQDEETAKKTLEDLGLVIEKVNYSKDKSQTNGVVLEQSLSANTTVDEGSKITLTVNKYDEDKDCTVNVNVASITGYTKKTDEDGKEIEPEQVTVSVYIDDKEYNAKPTKRDNEKYSTTIKTAGTVSIKVVVKDSKGNQLASDTKSVNLNNTTSVDFK